jgi:hypothetical protein
MPRFMRTYSLIAGPGGGSGIEIGDGTLRITFDIHKTDKKNPNKSKILIWNLKPDNRSLLERKGTRCVLKVGYKEEGDPITCFIGDVHFAFSRFDGQNVITELELGDGAKAIRDSMVSRGYGKGVSNKQALQDVAADMGLALNMPDDVPDKEWSNGLSFHGPARTALDKITHGSGLAWSIQNEQLQVIRADGNNNQTVFDLGADSGLIKTPERERKGAKESAKVTDEDTGEKRRVSSSTKEEDGWRVTSLILPTLLPGGRVKLSSRSVQGVFTISEVRHRGDTHGGDWFTELKLKDPSAAKTDKRNREPPGKTKVRQSPAGPLPLPPPPAPAAPQPGVGNTFIDKPIVAFRDLPPPLMAAPARSTGCSIAGAGWSGPTARAGCTWTRGR